MNEIPPGYNYWAFLSYSSKDKDFARWLHRSIENYGIPVTIVNRTTPAGHPAPRRFRPIFRDRDDARATADLGSELTDALRASSYLIVVCSADAAKSAWVNREIETFRDLGRRDRILAIIVDGFPETGSLSECFPPALLACEPLAADARPNGDGRKNAKLKLLSGMLGVSFDSLRKRDAELTRRRQFIVAVATSLLVIAFGSLFYRAHAARMRENLVLRQQYYRGYMNDMLEVRTLWDRDDFKQISAILAKYEKPANGDPRGPEWGFWKRLSKTDTSTSFSVPDAQWNGIAFDASGQRVALVDKKAQATFRDRATGKEPFRMAMAQSIWSVLFTPDGKYGASLSPTGGHIVDIWDPKDGRSVGKVKAPFATCVALPPDSNTSFDTSSKILCGDVSGGIGLWELPSGNQLVDFSASYTRHSTTSLTPERSLDFPSIEVSDIEWAASGEFFATGYVDGSVVVWDIRTHRIVSRFLPQNGATVTGIAFSPDDLLIAIQSFGGGNFDDDPSRGDIRVCVTGTGEIISRWHPHAAQHFVLGSGAPAKHRWFPGQLRPAFTADSTRLLTTGETSVQVWDARSGRWLYDINRSSAPVTALALSSGRKMVASIDGDTVRVGSAERSAATAVCRIDRPISFITLNQDRTLIAAIYGDPHIEQIGLRVWDTRDGRAIPLKMDSASSLSGSNSPWFSADGKEVGLGTERFSLTNGHHLSPLIVDAKSSYHKLMFTSDGNTVFLVMNNDDKAAKDSKMERIELVQLKTGQRVQLHDVPKESANIVAMSPDSRLVAAAGVDGIIRIWSMKDGAPLPSISAGRDITALAFNADGSRVSSGGRDRIVNVWKVANGERIATFAGHRREISGLAFSPDGRRLVSSSGFVDLTSTEPGEVRLWDMSTGEMSVEFPADRCQVYGGVAFSADGNRIFASTSNTEPPNDKTLTDVRPINFHYSRPVLARPLQGGIVCWDCTPPTR